MRRLLTLFPISAADAAVADVEDQPAGSVARATRHGDNLRVTGAAKQENRLATPYLRPAPPLSAPPDFSGIVTRTELAELLGRSDG